MPSKALLQRRTTLRTWLTLSAGKIESLLANTENPPSCTEVQVDIKSCVTVNVIEIEQICAPVRSTAIPHCLIEQLSHVPLVTTPVDNNLTID